MSSTTDRRISLASLIVSIVAVGVAVVLVFVAASLDDQRGNVASTDAQTFGWRTTLARSADHTLLRPVWDGLDLTGITAERWILYDLSAQEAILTRASLKGATIRFANLSSAGLDSADLRDADLGSSLLDNASLIGTALDRADLRHVSLRGADLSDATLWRADLRSADLSLATITSEQLRGACWNNATTFPASLQLGYQPLCDAVVDPDVEAKPDPDSDWTVSLQIRAANRVDADWSEELIAAAGDVVTLEAHFVNTGTTNIRDLTFSLSGPENGEFEKNSLTVYDAQYPQGNVFDNLALDSPNWIASIGSTYSPGADAWIMADFTVPEDCAEAQDDVLDVLVGPDGVEPKSAYVTLARSDC